ncbi:STAS domain protein [compost metagenome]
MPGVLIVRPGEALFFANVERILGAALHLIRHSQTPVHAVILSLEESPDLDGTSIEALQEFFVRVHQEGKRLILARLKDDAQTALAMLPEVEANGVMLSGLSVDGAVQQALKPYA